MDRSEAGYSTYTLYGGFWEVVRRFYGDKELTGACLEQQ